MLEVNLGSAFNEYESMEPEEVAQSVQEFMSALEEVGVKKLIMSDNEFNSMSANSLAASF